MHFPVLCIRGFHPDLKKGNATLIGEKQMAEMIEECKSIER